MRKQNVILYYKDQTKTQQIFFVNCNGQNIVTSHNILDAFWGDISTCKTICNLLNLKDTSIYKWIVSEN